MPDVSVVAEVKVVGVHVAAGEQREYAQQQTENEADEIEEFPCHVCFTEFREVRCLGLPTAAGRRISSSRSISTGVSSTDSSRSRLRRESS